MYERHRCKTCLFAQLTDIKRDRWMGEMFSAEGDAIRDEKNLMEKARSLVRQVAKTAP